MKTVCSLSHRGGDVYGCCSTSYGTKRKQALRRANSYKLQISSWKTVIELQLLVNFCLFFVIFPF